MLILLFLCSRSISTFAVELQNGTQKDVCLVTYLNWYNINDSIVFIILLRVMNSINLCSHLCSFSVLGPGADLERYGFTILYKLVEDMSFLYFLNVFLYSNLYEVIEKICVFCLDLDIVLELYVM